MHDVAPVLSLYRDLGPDAAERVVTRALGELTIELSFMSGQIHAHETDGLARQLRRVQRMGDNLGLTSLSRVAGIARDCLTSGDATAFAAVWARLLRVADRSLVTEACLLGRTLL